MNRPIFHFLFVCAIFFVSFSVSEGRSWIPFYGAATTEGFKREDFFDKSSLIRTQDGTIEVSTKTTLNDRSTRVSGTSYSDTSLIEINCGSKTYRSKDFRHSDGLWKKITSDDNTEALYQAVCLNMNPRIESSAPDELSKTAERFIDDSSDSFQKGDWDKAIEQASQALYFNPKSEVAYTNRAGAYANKGMFKEAEEDSNNAIAINPNYGLAYNNRGWAYEKLGRYDRAAADFKTGCSLGTQIACNNLNRIMFPGR